jgi:hypothetical protein
MAAENKKSKTDKRKHWGRGGNWLKEKGKGNKGISFYNSSQRQADKKISE